MFAKYLLLNNNYKLNNQLNCSYFWKKFVGIRFIASKNQKGLVSKKVAVSNVKGDSPSSTRWLRRQLTDPFVRKRIEEGFVSRSAFKLQEIDDKYHFLKPGSFVIDLGAAPGGWSQVAIERVHAASSLKESKEAKEKRGLVISVDLEEINIPKAITIQSDFTKNETKEKIKKVLDGNKVDAVISDMAPSTSGHRSVDHSRIMNLNEEVVQFANEVLKPGGIILVKIFQGGTEKEYEALLKKNFKVVKYIKPKASRQQSSEIYMFASNYTPEPIK